MIYIRRHVYKMIYIRIHEDGIIYIRIYVCEINDLQKMNLIILTID